MPDYSNPPRIAIVGGGPAGLTLGALLARSGVPFSMFELREKSTDAEDQPAGMLDLHTESGLAAIRECGLIEQIGQLSGDCTEAQKVADWDGNIVHQDQGEVSERPEISRNALTKLLRSCVPASAINWGHKLLSAATSSISSNGHVETVLDFGPHGKHTFDLVIGADGAWSPVRNLLTGIKPFYSGTQIITTTVRQQFTAKYPHLSELVGTGSFTALGLRNGIVAQRGPHDSLRVYTVLSTGDKDFATAAGLASQTPDAAKDRLLTDDTLLGRCGPILKELITSLFEEESSANPHALLDIKPLYMLPIGTSWEHKANATLIGDSAHLMCPWAGEGVNLAMCDALLLSKAITNAYHESSKDTFQETIDPLIKAFEAEQTSRSKEKAEETFTNGQLFYGREDGAKALAEFFDSVHQQLSG